MPRVLPQMTRRPVQVCGLTLVATLACLVATVDAPKATAASPAAAPGRVVVRFDDGVSAPRRAAVRRAVNVSAVRALRMPRAQLVRVPRGSSVKATAARLARQPGVLYAEPDYRYTAQATPNDPRFGQQWALHNTGQRVSEPAGTPDADIDAPEAWNVTTGSASVKVAVVDTGVAADHPDLAPNLIPGWDFVEGDATPQDENGHGTHVAGIIAARGNDGVGTTGVAWRTSIMPLRVLGANGSGDASDIADAFTYAAEHGADIVNASLGSGSESLLIRDAITRAPNTLFVVAAGNRGDPHNGASLYPCDLPHENIVCVGATDQFDRRLRRSDWGAADVDLFAPGAGILSTQPHIDTVFAEDFEQPLAGRWSTDDPDLWWSRSASHALQGSWGLGEEQAADDLQFVDSRVEALADFDLGGPSRFCRISADLRADLPAFDEVTIAAQEPSGAWRGVFNYTSGRDESFTGGVDGSVPVDTRVTFGFGTLAEEGGRTRLSVHIRRDREEAGRASLDDLRVRCLRFGAPADGYDPLTGTSMATAVVSGVAALRRARFPTEPATTLKAALLQSVDRKPALADQAVSEGRVNAERAVTIVPDVVGTPPATTITTAAEVADPVGIARESDGSLLFTSLNRVWRLRPGGKPTVVAGDGQQGFAGDGGPATAARFDGASHLAVAADGAILVSDARNLRIRRIGRDGRISTVAGNGTFRPWDHQGTGVAATSEPMRGLSGLTALPDGGFVYSEDQWNGLVRRVDATGMIRTVAGAPDASNLADGPDATRINLVEVWAVTTGADGALLMTTQSREMGLRVRRLDPSGALTTVAGGGLGPVVDGISSLEQPFGGRLGARPDGGIYAANGSRVRLVTTSGTAWTVAGTPSAGLAGDGGPGAAGWMGREVGQIAVAPDGFYATDFNNDRIRFVRVAAVPALPDTAVRSGPDRWIRSDTATVAFASPAPAAGFECRLDGGAWSACTSPKTFSAAGEGRHAAQLRAKTSVGADESPATVRWWRDTEPPDTIVTDAPSGTTHGTRFTFLGRATEAESTFQCRMDAGDWMTCAPWDALPDVGEGPHRLEVRARDRAGNVDPTPVVREFTVDNAFHRTQIVAGPTGTTGETTATLDWTPHTMGVSFRCRLDDGEWYGCKPPSTLRHVTAGPHRFEVQQLSAEGLPSGDPNPPEPAVAREWTVVGGPPETTITSGPAAGAEVRGDVEFAFASSRTDVTFECRLDGAAWAACASPRRLTGLADGGHRFDVRARDSQGQLDPSPATRNFSMDSVAPDTSITGGPSGATTATGAQLTFTSGDPSAVFECRLDGGPWAACTSPKGFSGLGGGAHRFEVRARDPAGNIDATPAVRTWTVGSGADTSPPETRIDSGPAALAASGGATLTFSASEVATFECRVDGGAWAACTSPRAVSGLADGDHVFAVRARDGAGNLDATPAERRWTVDTTPPVVALESALTDDAVTARFSVDDPQAATLCRLDGAAWQACTSPTRFTGVGVGDHVVAVRATDRAGNAADATTRFTRPAPASSGGTPGSPSPPATVSVSPGEPPAPAPAPAGDAPPSTTIPSQSRPPSRSPGTAPKRNALELDLLNVLRHGIRVRVDLTTQGRPPWMVTVRVRSAASGRLLGTARRRATRAARVSISVRLGRQARALRRFRSADIVLETTITHRGRVVSRLRQPVQLVRRR